jgi:prepilin-type N-terminal cleavage/methylation domain-containing protein
MIFSWASGQRRHTIPGFTIIELLIVIVIIAILAAVTLVAYNGITQRASNAQTIQAAGEYMKAYTLYAQEHSSYSGIDIDGCLGNSYSSGKCLAQDTSGTICFGLGTARPNTTLNAALQSYMGSQLPMPSQQQLACGTTTYSGLWANYNATAQAPIIRAVLNTSATSCPKLSPVANTQMTTSGNVVLCSYTLNPAS